MTRVRRIGLTLAAIAALSLTGIGHAGDYALTAGASLVGPVGNSFISKFHKGRYGLSIGLANDRINRIVASPAITYSAFEIDYGHGGIARSGFWRFLAGAEVQIPVLQAHLIVPQARIGYCLFHGGWENGRLSQHWQRNGLSLVSSLDLRREVFRRVSTGASLQYSIDYLEKGNYENSNYNRMVQNLQIGIVTSVRI